MCALMLILSLACADYNNANKIDGPIVILPEGKKMTIEPTGDPSIPLMLRGQIAFPATPVGNNATATITLKNPQPTTAMLLVQLEGGDFTVQPQARIIMEPGDTQVITVTFRPQEYSKYMENQQAIGTLMLINTRNSLPPMEFNLIGPIAPSSRSTE